MILTKRSLKIINLLLTGNRFTIEELAKFFSVTNRTITNNVRAIEKFFSNFDIFIEEHGSYCIKPKDFKVVMRLISQEGITSEERKEYIILKLLLNNMVTLNPIADELGITRRTLNYDMLEIKEFFAQREIELIPAAGKGIILKGREKAIRTLLSRFVTKLLLKKGAMNKFLEKILKKLDTQYDIASIEKVVTEICKEIALNLSPESYHFVIAVIIASRSREGFSDESLRMNKARFSDKYMVLKEKILSSKVLALNEYDTYIVAHILLNYDTDTYRGKFPLKKEVNELLETLKMKLNIDFPVDKSLLMMLSYSLKLADFKAEYNIQVNQKKDFFISESCQEIFYIVEDFTKIYFRDLNKDDILFITVLIKHYILKTEIVKTRNKHILVIDDSPKYFLGTLVKENLKDMYKIENATIISSYEVDRYFEENPSPDLILTLGNININRNHIPIIKLEFSELWPNLNFLEYYF